MLPRSLSGRIVEIVSEAREVKTFRFVSDEPLQYLPGQFLQISVPIPDGPRPFTRRSFSISSSPTEAERLQITVKRNPGGVVSNYLHREVQVGTVLPIRAPFGRFTWSEGEALRICLIGAGSGVTPLRAILRSIVARALPVRGVLLVFNRIREDIIFYDEFCEIARSVPGVRVIFSLTDPDPDWSGAAGRLSDSLLDAAFQEGRPELVYLCGPPSMMEAAIQILVARGIKTEQIKTEAYH
jgi:ferredoxin-NADP reductase